MNKYFIYDPDGNGFETFATQQERNTFAKEIIVVQRRRMG